MSALRLWGNEDTIELSRIKRVRGILIAIIAVTSLAPLVFVAPDDAPVIVNVYKYLAKTGAFVGSMLLIWQFLLGFRGVVSSVFPDLTWVVELHKWLGQFGVPIIALHPIFIGLYYGATEGTNIYALDLGDPFSQWVLLGMITLGVIAFVVVTSVFFRDRLGFYPWLYTHLSSYLIPPFLFVHSFLLGPTIQHTPMRFYWWFFAGVVALMYLYRMLHKLGVGSRTYRVTGAREVADSTTEIVMETSTRPFLPAPGQFVYLRHSLGENSHPYTVSTYDPQRRRLGVTVKEEGEQTARLQEASEGLELIVDGPYGVFTRDALATDLPVVMIAGGIGITPFRRLWETLEQEQSREAHLVYGSEYASDIAYRDELDALEHVNVVHVLNEEPDFDGETGTVTIEVLQRHLPRELSDYQFLICGPPAMILTLEESLHDADVPPDQVTHELFAT